jgi:hypothetical protein
MTAMPSLSGSSAHSPFEPVQFFDFMYKEEKINFPAGCWSWLGCDSLLFHYLTRSVLELYNFQCNGQNYPDQWEMIIIAYIIL